MALLAPVLLVDLDLPLADYDPIPISSLLLLSIAFYNFTSPTIFLIFLIPAYLDRTNEDFGSYLLSICWFILNISLPAATILSFFAVSIGYKLKESKLDSI